MMTRTVLWRLKVALPAALLIAALCLPAAVQASGTVHIVRPGETLYSIAARYGTTIWAIAQANGLHNVNYIYAGQRLVIPTGGGGGCACVHVVRRGETLYRLAARYGTTVGALARMNGLRNPNYIWAGQRLCVPCADYCPPPCGFYYVVQRGDTLYSIARRYGTCVQTLAAVNGLRDPNRIYTGQRLWIPCATDP